MLELENIEQFLLHHTPDQRITSFSGHLWTIWKVVLSLVSIILSIKVYMSLHSDISTDKLFLSYLMFILTFSLPFSDNILVF